MAIKKLTTAQKAAVRRGARKGMKVSPGGAAGVLRKVGAKAVRKVFTGNVRASALNQTGRVLKRTAAARVKSGKAAALRMARAGDAAIRKARRMK